MVVQLFFETYNFSCTNSPLKFPPIYTTLDVLTNGADRDIMCLLKMRRPMKYFFCPLLLLVNAAQNESYITVLPLFLVAKQLITKTKLKQ